MKNFSSAAMSLALFLAVLFAFLAIPVWWLESRFGSISAIATVGGFIGVAVFAGGAAMASKIQHNANQHTADIIASVEETRGRFAMVQREYARQDREQLAAYAKMQTIDVQRVNQLATQQARLLMDTERRGWDLQQAQQDAARQPAAAWAMDDDDASEGVRYYE
jgi:predicted PurR-regulated permease PerM